MKTCDCAQSSQVVPSWKSQKTYTVHSGSLTAIRTKAEVAAKCELGEAVVIKAPTKSIGAILQLVYLYKSLRTSLITQELWTML